MKKIVFLFSLVTFFILLALLPLSLLSATKAAASADRLNNDYEAVLPPAVPLGMASTSSDAFGYTYQDELEANGPTYNFIDISSTGTALITNTDDVTRAITLPFGFSYYGITSNQFWVGDNGAVIFNPTSSSKIPSLNACPLTSAAVPQQDNLIAPWWDDWTTVPAGSGVYWRTFGASPNRYTVIQWNQVGNSSHFGAERVTFELILYETSNVILFQYKDVTAGTDGSTPPNELGYGSAGTVGLRGNSTPNTLQYETCNSAVLTNTRSIRFQNSSITVVKDVSGATNSQPFTFTGSTGLTNTFTLTDDGSAANTRKFTPLPGVYTITENALPSGWNLANLSCQSRLAAVSLFTGTTSISTTDLSARTANITNLAPGDAITCTFTNLQLGQIILQKETNPASDPTTFNFTSTITGASSFTLSTALSQTFPISPGTYAVTEQNPVPQGWDLTGLSCADSSSNNSTGHPITRTADINLGSGETVTCVYTNTQRGEVRFVKVTNPPGDPATFNLSLSGGPAGFSLPTFPLTNTGLYTTLVPANNVYTLTETALTGWDVTGSDCGGGSINGFTVSPGGVVTCTITNTKRVTLVVDKTTLPSNDLTSFNFTLTGGPDNENQNFGLANTTTPHNSGLIKAGTYTVTETVPATWTLVLTNCNGCTAGSFGSSASDNITVTLTPGEVVTWTFTNQADPGTLIVQKVTTPTIPTPGLFTFTTSIPATPTFTLDTSGAAPISQTLVITPGVYTVSEDIIPGWDLTSASCSNGSPISSITIQAGEIVTCTFNNAKRGTLRVQKDSIPDDGQLFTFTSSNTAISPTFSISDDGVVANYLDFLAPPGNYLITEGGPTSGWDFTDVACLTDSLGSNVITGTRTANINLAAGGAVTCIYTNTKRATLVVDKVTAPISDTTVFNFTTAGSGLSPFSLTDTAIPMIFTVVPGSGYAITETTPSTWTLASSTCTDGSPVNGIDLAAGEVVTCTFTNVAQPANLVVQKVTTPTNSSQVFTFTTSITTTPSFTLSTASSSPAARTLVITPGNNYTVSEELLPDWSLDAVSCSKGTTTATGVTGLNLVAGEVVTCTFYNDQLAEVRVDKVTLPANDPTSFNFTLSGGPTLVTNTFSLTDTESPASSYVRAGTYAVTETISSGWTLSGATCTSGTIDNFTLARGDVLTCTFTNTKKGGITIIKNGLPPSDLAFNFNSYGFIPSTPSNPFGYSSFSLVGNTNPISNRITFTNMLPKVYFVQENFPLPANWTLTDITCTDINSSGEITTSWTTINLDPGETVTCTYTNRAANSKIIVQKVTAPGSDAQVFTYTTSIGGSSPFTLTTGLGGPISRTFTVTAGTYSISEQALPGWDLSTPVTCSDGSPISAINMSPNETVTCTFTNTKRARLLVTKVTVPPGDPSTFNFSLTGTSTQNFTLTHGSTHNSGFILAGTYALTETAPGWTQTSSCSDGSGIGAINLGPGEVVTCIVTNTVQPSSITVVKDAGNQDKNFNFMLSISNTGTTLSNFILNDVSPVSNTRTFPLAYGQYAVVEIATSLWSLANLVCNDPTGNTTVSTLNGRANIDLGPGENITCTFVNTVNTAVGSITIVKNTTPTTSTQLFGFTSTFSPSNFSLYDDGSALNNQISFGSLTPGVYNVTEAVVSGWSLTGLSCNDPDRGSSVNLGASTAVIDLDAGENIICTFVNNFNPSAGSITIVKNTTPTTSTQLFGFTSTFSPSNFSLYDDGSPLHNQRTFGNLTPGVYTVTEAVVPGWTLAGLSCLDPDNGSGINLGTRTSTIDLDAGENVTCTFVNNGSTTPITGSIYLPIIMKTEAGAPDLTITSFSVTGSNPNYVVTIVVQNIGTAATDSGFWVDFYVNPTSLPDNAALRGDRRWQHVGSNQGIAWEVPALGPGQSITLSSNGVGGLAPNPGQTIWTGSLPAGTNNLYSFADSYDSDNDSWVEILESNENNNLASQSVTASASAASAFEPATLPDPLQLPPR